MLRMAKSILVVLVVLGGLPRAAVAEKDATPGAVSFQEGDVIGFDQVDRLRAHVPPELWANRDYFFYQGMQLEIGPSHYDYTPPAAYQAATERFAGEVRIGPDGSLENYTAGQPFPVDQIDCERDPMAGVKYMWNFQYRWAGAGNAGSFRYTYWDRGEKLPLYYEGVGRKIPVSHRVEPQYLGENGGNVFKGEKRSFVTGTDIHAPFDARGIKLLTYRYKSSDGPIGQAKNDDTWVYVPTLRRVRRVSTSQRTDAISGTDFTLDDLYSFSGIIPQYEWTCLEESDLLAPGNTRNKAYPVSLDHDFGPLGLSLASDRWEMRRMVKIRMVPKNDDHPYAYKDFYIDKQTLKPHYSFAYDQKDELWKMIWHAKRWSEDKSLTGEWYPSWEGMPRPFDLAVVADLIINVQTGTGSRIEFWDATGPPFTQKARLRRYIDTGRLTLGR